MQLSGRLRVHVDPGAFPMKRKRIQPRGSRPCPDCNTRTISANADRCANCERAKRGISDFCIVCDTPKSMCFGGHS